MLDALEEAVPVREENEPPPVSLVAVPKRHRQRWRRVNRFDGVSD